MARQILAKLLKTLVVQAVAYEPVSKQSSLIFGKYREKHALALYAAARRPSNLLIQHTFADEFPRGHNRELCATLQGAGFPKTGKFWSTTGY
jgi:hypothetical protein